MTRVDLRPLTTAPPRSAGWPRWPLSLVGAGLLGLGAAALSRYDDVAGQRAGSLLALGTALLLVVASACWRRHVEPRTRSSTAAHVVPLALVASAAGLALGHHGDLGGWAGIMAAAAALAWMAGRERSVSRPVGALSALAAAVVPAAPAVAGPAWLLVVGLGLAFGRSTISR